MIYNWFQQISTSAIDTIDDEKNPIVFGFARPVFAA